VSEAELRFELPGGARVLFTARADGNLSSVGGDDAEHGEDNRELLRARIGVRALVRGYQVHGARVRVVDADPPPGQGAPPEADGQATAAKDLAMMVLAADCVPVGLVAPGALAMVHAGWRGLAAGVLEQGVLALRTLSPAGPLVAIVGPCAGSCCYEVGPEVTRALGCPTAPGGAHETVDLRAIAHERLLAAGVHDIADARACTICDERFFSHRREGDRAGRQAGLAWLS
jgi:YfiH family protein